MLKYEHIEFLYALGILPGLSFHTFEIDCR